MPDSIESLKKLFRAYDDGDGDLSFEEFSAFVKRLDPCMKKDALQAIFKSADEDNSGKISFDEFVDFVYGVNSWYDGQAVDENLDLAAEAEKWVAARMKAAKLLSTDEVSEFDLLVSELEAEADPSAVPMERRLDFARRLLRGTNFAQMATIGCGVACANALVGDALNAAQLYTTFSLTIPLSELEGFVSYTWAADPHLRALQLQSLLVDTFCYVRCERVKLWIDKFSSPQVGPAFAQCQRFAFFFQEYLALCPRTFVILSPEYLDRLWCRYELVCSVALLPLDEVHVGIDQFLTTTPWDVYADEIRTSSTETAKCSHEADRNVLRTIIADNFQSPQALDQLLRLSVLSLAGRCMLMNLNAMRASYQKLCALCSELELEKLLAALGKVEQVSEAVLGVDRQYAVFRSFTEHVLPLLQEEQQAAIRANSGLALLRQGVESFASDRDRSAQRAHAEALWRTYGEARQALLMLDKKQVDELKRLNKPPPAVSLLTSAIAIFFRMSDDSFKSVVTLFRDSGSLVRNFVNFDISSIDAKQLKKLRKLVAAGLPKPEDYAKISVAASGLAKWVWAIYALHDQADYRGTA